MLPTLISALRETLYMVLYSTLFSMLIGIPLGMWVIGLSYSKNGFNRGLSATLHAILLAVKATPYILVMLLFIPTTNWLINHHISFTGATIVPLSVAGTMLIAQAVCEIFKELMSKWQSTTKSMGATSKQTMLLILLPESLTRILETCSNTAATILGFSIIAGAFGAGGLGQLAIEKTITEPNFLYAIISIVTLIAIQQIFKYTAILILPPKT
ncbi:MAG TPA: ABC transporter permease subunit [Gammaproteobacteria bacterium]|nr:ABC transporter permease subunit [Gammaproteobacteria bacterium]